MPLLGKKVQCLITEFEGIAIAKAEYINGCIQYCVKPKIQPDKKVPDGIYIDSQQLEQTGEGPIERIILFTEKDLPTLGTKMIDLITDFQGIATVRITYLNGRIDYGIKGKSIDGKMPDAKFIDFTHLRIVADAIPITKKETGGIMQDAPPNL